MGGGGEEVGHHPARLAVQGSLNITCIINPDRQVKEVDSSGGEVVRLTRFNLKLDGGMAGIKMSSKLEQILLRPSPEEQHVINKTFPQVRHLLPRLAPVEEHQHLQHAHENAGEGRTAPGPHGYTQQLEEQLVVKHKDVARTHKLHKADQELCGDGLVLPHVHGGLKSMQALLKRYICVHTSNVQGDRNGARRLGTATILLTDDIQHMSGVLQVRVKLLDLLLGMLVHPMTDTLGH